MSLNEFTPMRTIAENAKRLGQKDQTHEPCSLAPVVRVNTGGGMDQVLKHSWFIKGSLCYWC